MGAATSLGTFSEDDRTGPDCGDERPGSCEGGNAAREAEGEEASVMALRAGELLSCAQEQSAAEQDKKDNDKNDNAKLTVALT